MKYGIYIGSFNPIHNGHIDLAKHLLDKKIVDKIIFIPAGNYWDKQSLYPVETRIEMIKLAIKNEENMSVNAELAGTDYTYQVLDQLNLMNIDYYLIMGADTVTDLDKWEHFDTVKATKMIVVSRDETDIDFYMNLFGIRQYIKVDDFKSDISSTRIREDIGKAAEYLNGEVYAYIFSNHLYRKDNF